MIPPRDYNGQRVVVVGTGPSLTVDAIDALNRSDVPKFGVNNVYQDVRIDVHMACNVEWWDYYWPRDRRLRNGHFHKWTWDEATSRRYGLRHIEGAWGEGLSKMAGVIYYGHSSGYQALGLAHQYGATEIVLIGYDLRFPRGYDRTNRREGGMRHYFGEYPAELQHWPMVGGEGEMTGLLKCYRTIRPEDYGIRIINCSPGSALDCFETGNLEDWL